MKIRLCFAVTILFLTACGNHFVPDDSQAKRQAPKVMKSEALIPERTGLKVRLDGDMPEIQKNDAGELLEQQADEIYHMWNQESEQPETNHYKLNGQFIVCKAAVGDLNGDHQEDMAVVVEHTKEESDDESLFSENTRETFVLLNQNGRFTVLCRNKGLAMGEWDGGPYGDPFADIVIKNGILTISNFGGSSSRWGYDYSFIYAEHTMRMSKMVCLSYNIFLLSGFVEEYDYINGTYRMLSESNMDSGLSGLLLNYGTFSVPECYFEHPVMQDIHVEDIPCLPRLGEGYGYHEELVFEMKLSADDALGLVQRLYYTDAAGQKILWTDELRNNYTKLLHYQMPDWYYENGKGRLSYCYLDPIRGNDEEICGARHVVMWESFDESEETLLYYVDTVTGAVQE